MVVTNLYKGQGVSSFVMSYFRQLNHKEVQMDFALLSNQATPYYQEIQKAGGNIYILPPLKNTVAHINRCNEILKQGKYEVISDNSLLLTLPMMICAKHQHVPVRILHIHSTRLSSNPVKEKIEKLFFPLLKYQCTDFCACGRAAGESILMGQDFTVIPNVISPDDNSLDLKKREEIRKKMNVADRIVVGTVGRTSPEKNPYFAFKVIQQLAKTVPKLTYWWIGSGPMDQELANYVKENKLDHSIRLLGNRDDVNDLYQAMDIFFLPSHFEGLPLTGIEAQAYGLPCIISSSVTSEIVYTDLVKFVSLSDPLDKWVESFQSEITTIPDRRSYNKELRTSIFSAEGAGERITKTYYEMLQKRTHML